MAKYYVNKSTKGGAVHLGVESAWGKGFASIVLNKDALLHAANALGMVVGLSELRRRQRSVRRFEKEAQRLLNEATGRRYRKDPRFSTGLIQWLRYPSRRHRR